MNNGYQKSNGCGADKEGGKFFKTFFFTKLQSKHVRPLAYNGRLCAVLPYPIPVEDVLTENKYIPAWIWKRIRKSRMEYRVCKQGIVSADDSVFYPWQDKENYPDWRVNKSVFGESETEYPEVKGDGSVFYANPIHLNLIRRCFRVKHDGLFIEPLRTKAFVYTTDPDGWVACFMFMVGPGYIPIKKIIQNQ